MNRKRVIFRVALAAALLGAIVFFALHRDFVQVARLEGELQRFGSWAPLLFIALYAAATVVFVPGSVFTWFGAYEGKRASLVALSCNDDSKTTLTLSLSTCARLKNS